MVGMSDFWGSDFDQPQRVTQAEIMEKATKPVSNSVVDDNVHTANVVDNYVGATLKVVLLNEDATVPERAHLSDVGYDLFASADTIIEPGESKEVPIGLRVVLPSGYWALLRPRSSTAKQNVDMFSGVIDPGYTGPLGVRLYNAGTANWSVKKGQKFAQLLLIPMHTVDRIVVIKEEDIPDTDRGSGGWGSSGTGLING